MKPKYIKRYKNHLKIRKHWWYMFKRMFFWKNKGKLRINQSRKHKNFVIIKRMKVNRYIQRYGK